MQSAGAIWRSPNPTFSQTASRQELLGWPQETSQEDDELLKPLRLLFDRVQLSDRDREEKHHYWPAIAIADEEPEIPYPQSERSKPEKLEELKASVKSALESLNAEDWQNLSLLGLILEKFGSYLSWGESDVALADMARSIGAVAAALAHNPNAKELSLIAGDLSGIQKFIYTISSDGALKSLRARSFYLELVVEELVQQLLEALELPRTNVIYAGGGNLYLLAPAREETKTAVNQVRQQFNQWLREEFQGKIFLALDCLEFESKDVSGTKFADRWSEATKNLAGQKSRKFADRLEDFLKPRQAHEPCRVCHRDDVENLKPLKQDEADSALACGTCRRMFELGGQLLKVKAIVRSHQKPTERDNTPYLKIELPAVGERGAKTTYYFFFDTDKPIVPESDTVLLVNNWNLETYRLPSFHNPVPLLLGQYGKGSEVEQGFMSGGEMAEKAEGIARLGYLRMDVDRLGLIFARGLGESQTLPRLAGLSRQMSYFFKVYLNSLAEKRNCNMPKNLKRLTASDRRNLLFIYAGGDDLFVTGAWNEVVEFAFDIYQCFRAYAGGNPDITISGGIEIVGPKYPLYQAADESGDAEHSAKDNGRDSLGLFGEAFKWAEWLGQANKKLIKSRYY
ncbi:MAG: type III-A CRISPR-associated protein Cas10/Csm1 [Oscillatoria sp. SIO1A7]|nr:type III-A CRISPR-associated protein Cas10/Csm1 [Oscillatoria sp. SIO1A7]